MKKNIVLQRPLNQIREGCKITHLLLTHPPNPLILIIEGHGGSLECKSVKECKAFFICFFNPSLIDEMNCSSPQAPSQKYFLITAKQSTFSHFAIFLLVPLI